MNVVKEHILVGIEKIKLSLFGPRIVYKLAAHS